MNDYRVDLHYKQSNTRVFSSPKKICNESESGLPSLTGIAQGLIRNTHAKVLITRRIFLFIRVFFWQETLFFASTFASVFWAIIGISLNCFMSGYARDAVYSHMYSRNWKRHPLRSVKPFSEVGGGSAIYYWILFQYFLLDTIFFLSFDWIRFFFRLRGCSGVTGWVICQ